MSPARLTRLTLVAFAVGTASLLASHSPAAAGPIEGAAAWEAGDYAKAVAEWRPAAIKGDAAAQYGLGQAYLYGRGVPVDLKQAQLWFEKAAAQGSLEAQDNLGLLLFQQGERQKALPYLERSSARGEPRAQYVLGTAKFNGDLVDKDWVGAYALMTRASAAGLPQASRALAQMDTQIPLAQRQQGQVIAREMEASGRTVAFPPPPLPTSTASAAPTLPAAGSVASVVMPPSNPAPVPVPIPGGSVPLATVSKPVVQAPPLPTASRTTATARAAPAPTPAVTRTSAARTGDWRIQLGAFRNAEGARTRWADVKRAVPSLAALQTFYKEAGPITRIQAGPFATKAAADRACRSVEATGRACFAVRD